MELDFGGGYVVFTPKQNLYGDRFNPFLQSSAGMLGLNYERCFASGKYAVKAGCAVVNQYGGVGSLHIPVQLNGIFIGERYFSRINVGFVGGIGLNSMLFMPHRYFIITDPECEVSFKKRFYVAPHLGICAAVNLGRFAITSDFLFHCFIPEFMLYKVSYTDMQNNRIVEYNTNRSIGMTLKFGIMYRFGRK
ncbi:MAG: hypothetical protein LBL04_05125 [Bacteroidales bacterium]|jgi:hypothetical protein|nr:hypothetical protein [Bacteroidales bacterium]